MSTSCSLLTHHPSSYHSIISPALTVQFDPVDYQETEGDDVEFMIRLSSPADRDVTVVFTTMDGTAGIRCMLNQINTPVFFPNTYVE